MDEITNLLKSYHTDVFEKFGPTAKGVDWNDECEMLVRYDKMLRVLDKDFYKPDGKPSLVDVGCGWGGLYKRASDMGVDVAYTGIDVAENMVSYASQSFPDAVFHVQDIFDLPDEELYDFAVCNAILTQKHQVSIPAMENFAKRLVSKMFTVARHGIAFNLMSTRVNFMVDNLYYHNPVEMLAWVLSELSPRVRMDHGYSSLVNGRGKFFDYTVYVYKR